MLVFIGVIVGLVMGLTGAGGALIAIPFFMHFLDMSLKEASTYSLLAVVIASASNFLFQRKNAQFNIALIFIFSSFVGSYLSHPFKNDLPEIWIATALIILALYSLYTVWFPPKVEPDTVAKNPHWIMTIFLGALLGVLTTFTGLGGGVLMIPVFIRIYHLAYDKAVATSIVVMGASALFSFLIQITNAPNTRSDFNYFYLICGTLAASYLVKYLISKTSQKTSNLIRKIAFTIVVTIAIAKFI